MTYVITDIQVQIFMLLFRTLSLRTPDSNGILRPRPVALSNSVYKHLSKSRTAFPLDDPILLAACFQLKACHSINCRMSTRGTNAFFLRDPAVIK